ncbi:hypothetical protein AMIS_49070 [Actinoplanes missouriensis 431]|uniref:Uncharacterized protein n=1 Tax=Actinoplanes missouriensis (strain ATCC 14538 / DSM 43046 / CBS 188.64 / JCM 3121 / NBRC 102363 / NCIMB 12654 / NRRL B-3342 / UNCC 431) TaxID=512565 RepID=I0HAU0_ACTM4|nr:hypothetical protein [Actinoplanes missouriensis]BAL90127.1 hypothetical protein AMIS_49070 [Actinoplanes missouriensis 431]
MPVPRIGHHTRRQILDHRAFEMPVSFRTEDQDVSRWTTVALAEYQSLRAESLQAQQAQQTIMQFGITGIAVLIGLSLQVEERLIAILALLFVVPLLSIFIVSVWFVEIFRSIRAGAFLSCLEVKINRVLGGDVPALEWESWLRRHPEVRMFVRDRMSFGVLYVLNIAGLVVSAFLARGAGFHMSNAPLVVSLFAVSSVGLLLLGFWVYRHYEKRVYLQSIDLNAALTVE